MTDFDRNVYCVAGLPFDAIDMNKAISIVRNARYVNSSCFMSTPNMNFITNASTDADFLNSVIYSDIVVADGTPIIWMAKLLGVPIRQRIAGSSLFEVLRHEKRRKMKVFFMGGVDGVAEAAGKELNESSTGLSCVGFFSPGFGTIDEMSTDEIINKINSSNADFLVVALGAKKGQAWIMKNLPKITIPLVSHLGAVLNFEAKRIKRSPQIIQNTGFEWLWRIKEEPSLWRRYFKDGQYFLKLLITRIIPMKVWLKKNKDKFDHYPIQNDMQLTYLENHILIKVTGVVGDPITDEMRQLFRDAAKEKKHVHIDLSDAEYIGFGFFGLVLMLKKNLDRLGIETKIVSCSKNAKKIVEWNGLSYLKA